MRRLTLSSLLARVSLCLLFTYAAASPTRAKVPAQPQTQNQDGIVNVLDFANTGANPADDCDDIQNAINSLGANGGTILFPAGRTFTCISTLTLQGKKNIHLVGTGGGQSFAAPASIIYTGNSSHFLYLKDTRSIEIRDLSFHSTVFTGTLVVTGDPCTTITCPDIGTSGLLMQNISFNLNSGAKAAVGLEYGINSAIQKTTFYGGQHAIIGRDAGGVSGYSNAITISDCTFIDQRIASIRNAGEAWRIENNTAQSLAGGNVGKAGFYAQDLTYDAWALSFRGNWIGDIFAPGGTAITARAVGLEVSGNYFYANPDTAPNTTFLKIHFSQGVNITGNNFVGHVDMDDTDTTDKSGVGIDFLSTASYGVHVAGNNFNLGVPIINDSALGPKTYLGNNKAGSPVTNITVGGLHLRGTYPSTTDGSFVGFGDNTYFGLEGAGSAIGFVKRGGARGLAAFDLGGNFTIAESSGFTIDPTNAFTSKFTVNGVGASVYGLLTASRANGEEAGRFTGSSRSFITLGNGFTPSAGGYVLFDPAPSRLQLGVHASPSLTVDSSGNVAIPGNLSVTGSVSKGSGTFLIDHPLEPKNKNLYHGFVEAPRYDLIYRGKAQLIAGTATASIDAASNLTPGTFSALTQNSQCFVQNETGWEPVRCSIADGNITIACKDPASTDRVGWLIVAERNDAFIRKLDNVDKQGRLIPEHNKPTAASMNGTAPASPAYKAVPNTP